MLYENYIDRMKNYHDLKESIGIDLINPSDNILYLKDKCYTSFLDLAIVYYIALNSHQKFWFPKNVFKKWSITPELLRKQALENIHKTSQFALKYYPFLSLHDTCEKSKNIVALVDTQLLNSIRQELATSFYIFPQSQYEIRIIPEYEIIQRENLKNLKKELISSNDNLPADYIVSNHIYHYNKTLTIAI